MYTNKDFIHNFKTMAMPEKGKSPNPAITPYDRIPLGVYTQVLHASAF
jgi:hypothetical protein